MAVNICLCAIFAMVRYLQSKNIGDLGFIFNAWWGIILVAFSVSRNVLYPIRSNLWWYIGVGTVAFNCVYLWCVNSPRTYVMKGFGKGYTWEKETNLYIVINRVQMVMFLLMVPLVFRALPYILEGGLLNMRKHYVGNASGRAFMSTLERLFYIHFGVFPCVAACILVHALLWSKGTVKLRKLWIDALNLICIILISGARTYVFYTAIYFVGAYIINRRTIRKASPEKFRKLKRNVAVIILLVLIAGFAITAQRTFGRTATVWENLRDTLIIYFTGGIKVFDIALLHPHAYGLENLTYGSTLIAGILNIGSIVLNAVPVIGSGITWFPTDIAQQYLTNNIQIGPKLQMNAFATMYYYFMRDFGIVGILLGVSILAVVAARCAKSRKINYFNDIIKMQVLLLIIFSVCWWEPYRMEFWVIGAQALFWYQVANMATSKKEES